MRILITAAALVACGTPETKTTTTDVEQTENVENTFTQPIDVVDEEAKRLQELESTNFDAENENITTENNSPEEQ